MTPDRDVERYHDKHDDLYIDSLHLAFKTAFQWVRDRQEDGEVKDFAGDWADLVASALRDVRMTAIPGVDGQNPPLPFIVTHRVETELYHVARGGMAGGPTIDLLLQIWFDTEDMLCGYGIPLVFRTIPQSARMSDFMWHDLQDLCRLVTLATPSGRLIFLSDEGNFEWFKHSSWRSQRWMLVSDMHSIAGGRLPPRPARGRLFNDFCLDLASGWIGDPALSGLKPSKLLDDFQSTFSISHLLRIKIVREGGETWRPVQLPF